MKDYSILQISNYVDRGGVYELLKGGTTIRHKEETYTYISSGLVRDVFRSADGNFVLKVPSKFDAWGFLHNKLEVECYNEAPDWCKQNVAKSSLTDEGYCLQEYLRIDTDCGNYFRELGFREDGTCVIFDCDIFLDFDFSKPKSGFKYQEVFEKAKFFGAAHVEAVEIPKRLRRKQMKSRGLHFPNLDNQKFRQDSSGVYIDGQVVPYDIAVECGFLSS